MLPVVKKGEVPYANVERCSKVPSVAYLLRSCRSVFNFGIFCAWAVMLIGCDPHRSTNSPAIEQKARCVGMDLSVPTEPITITGQIAVSSARNAWTQFALEVDLPSRPAHAQLRFPQLNAGIVFSPYQILPAAVNLNEADFVRQHGDSTAAQTQPRVLLPLPVVNGVVDLSKLRNPTQATLLWIDAHIAPTVQPADYSGKCELFESTTSSPVADVPVKISVENITLPAQRHLHIAAPLDWGTLSQQYPDVFAQAPARLLNSGDPRRQQLMQLLQDHLQLAHENDADVFVPQLQPIVKWPLGKLPEIDWTDFDSVALPLLNGNAFTDHRPIAFWPLPAIDSLEQFNLASKIQYWRLANAHFAQQHWAAVHPVILKPEIDGPSNHAQALLLSAEASQVLSADANLLAMVPLNDEQIEPAANASRLILAAPGLVSEADHADIAGSNHWLAAAEDTAAGQSEQAMRSLAWQAFANGASILLCEDPLPTADSVPAHQIVWVYPGERFGTNHPLASVQLKWLRQAEQDYEYLLLSAKTNPDTKKVCRLVTHPVQLPADAPDQQVSSRFAGQSDQHACERARQMLTAQMLHNSTAPAVDPTQLATIRWFAAQEKQNIAVNSVDWKWNLNSTGMDAALNVMVYNTMPQMPEGGHLDWINADGNWQALSPSPRMTAIAPFHVATATTAAHFNPANISVPVSRPIQIQFTDDFTRETASCEVALPVAISARRKIPLVIDGILNDWYPADAIGLNQPLVKMLNHRQLLAGKLDICQTPSSLYSGWSDDHFYFSFRLGGVVASDLRSTRNFVQYDHGRAWGEDLCELLIQPIYIDNSTGPLLHIVCKPGGNWVEQQAGDQGWQPFEASGVRYASGVDAAEKVWRGEVAIPWRAINATGHGRPALLRFNFIQHQQETGQSASWAGPIDQSRDGKLMGLLMIKEQ